jgi:hypothetical protein
LTVRWPSGNLQNLGQLDVVDRTLVVAEEAGIVP